MKKELLEIWGEKYCTLDEIANSLINENPKISRQSVIWSINDLVKQGRAVRVGRGVYLIAPKKQFSPIISTTAKSACSLLANKFRYLDVTVTDTYFLGELMNLQPFSTVVTLEVKKIAVNAVLSAMRKAEFQAYDKNDYPKMERYIKTAQPIFIRPELAINPTMVKENNVRLANIEKTLVDLVCDDDIYGQYQGEELQNIFQNATAHYAINYSKLLKYAGARKRKEAVTQILQDTDEYQKVRNML
jgi:predicted transcriptional regulator of viral defense system